MNIRGLQKIYESYYTVKSNLLKEDINSPEDPEYDPLKQKEEELTPEQKEKMDIVEARIAISKVKLNKIAPFLGRILSGLKVVIVKNKEEMPTMAVDAFGNIYVGLDFGAEIDERQFVSVFAHEAMHIANYTFLRFGKKENMYVWNLATDAIINWGLVSDGYTFPKGVILPDLQTGVLDLGALGKVDCYDQKTKVVHSPEEIYEQIMNNINRVKVVIRQLPPGEDWRDLQKKYEKHNKGLGLKEQINQIYPEAADGEGQWIIDIEDTQTGEKAVIPTNPPPSGGGGEPGQGQPGGPGGTTPGDGPGNGPGNGPGGKPKGYSDEDPLMTGQNKEFKDRPLSDEEKKKALEEYIKQIYEKGQIDKHLTEEQAKKLNPNVKPLSDEDVNRVQKELQKKLKDGMIDAKASASRSGGQGVGSVRGVLDASLSPYVDWQSVVKDYLKQAAKGSFSWVKPNLRALAGGYQAPSRLPAQSRLECIFAVDTSGSIGSKELAQAITYINDIAQTVREVNVRVCLWHHSAYYLSPPLTSHGALRETLSRMSVHGGGTTISSIDPFLKSKHVNPYFVAYITDGYVEHHPKFGNYKKLFIIVSSAGARSPGFVKLINDLFSKHGQIIITSSLDA